jgi:hypothetical protein
MGYPIGQNELRKKKSWLQILNLNQGKFQIQTRFKPFPATKIWD